MTAKIAFTHVCNTLKHIQITPVTFELSSAKSPSTQHNEFRREKCLLQPPIQFSTSPCSASNGWTQPHP
eukprot:CAMPEP_0177580996 /NCGR_PEP_ID=MMETSP0419_2-20121207/1893_1 /TAXON_ID=582737 /ORGANISM="Tetraselmis sp., Strain GSL018" /LENGTH=68 /DNA_ID=CAMNT_0019069971 /DNA_START=130 /DNA_END=336 /DNA_ORIENTATION=-